MVPDQPPPTADSRGSKTENLNEGGQNKSSNQNQMLATPTPPETEDAKEKTKVMDSDVKSNKEGELRLAPGSVGLEPPQPITPDVDEIEAAVQRGREQGRKEQIKQKL